MVVGTKPMSGKGNPMFGCRIPPAWLDEFELLSKQTGKKPAELARDAFAAYLGVSDQEAGGTASKAAASRNGRKASAAAIGPGDVQQTVQWLVEKSQASLVTQINELRQALKQQASKLKSLEELLPPGTVADKPISVSPEQSEPLTQQDEPTDKATLGRRGRRAAGDTEEATVATATETPAKSVAKSTDKSKGRKPPASKLTTSKASTTPKPSATKPSTAKATVDKPETGKPISSKPSAAKTGRSAAKTAASSSSRTTAKSAAKAGARSLGRPTTKSATPLAASETKSATSPTTASSTAGETKTTGRDRKTKTQFVKSGSRPAAKAASPGTRRPRSGKPSAQKEITPSDVERYVKEGLTQQDACTVAGVNSRNLNRDCKGQNPTEYLLGKLQDATGKPWHRSDGKKGKYYMQP